MPDPFIVQQLQRLPLFEHLPANQLAQMADIVQVLQFQPGALVVRQGTPAQGLFLLVAGRGLLTKLVPNPSTPSGGMIEQPIGEMSAGKFIGAEALFQAVDEPASLRIVEPATLLFISRVRLVALLSANPELRANIERAPTAPAAASKPIFAGQRSDEVVVQMLRRHWWSFIRFVWIPVLISTGLIVGAVLLSNVSFVFTLLLLLLALLLPIIVMYLLYIEWQDDALIITDQRIVRISTTLLNLENQISEVALDGILEVSINIPIADPFAHLFGYGTVEIRTAGPHGNVQLSMVTEPDRVRDLIFMHREHAQKQMAEAEQQRLQAEVAQMLGAAPSTAAQAADQPARTAAAEPMRAVRQMNFLQTRFVTPDGSTVYRKHYTDWLHHITLPAVLIIASGIAMLINLLVPAFLGQWQIMGFIIPFFFILIGSVLLYLGDWDWRNDLFIVEDDSITIIKQRPLWLQNHTDQIRLSQVDSVVATTRGLLDNLLQRGMVEISLVGSDAPKLLKPVYKPQEIQAEISRRQASYRAKMQQQENDQRRTELADLLATYHRQVTGQPPTQENTIQQRAQPVNLQPPPAEPPTQPLRDRSRPPRVPRIRPDDQP
jgi:CRP-like cAMP-binding protein/membrane protein YdbS with pleckstrin-like domain